MSRAATAEVVALAADLIRLDTVNPPGREAIACASLEPILQQAGFEVDIVDHTDGRASLIARRGAGARAPLILSGHLDVVPPGTQPWRHAPFGGEVDGDRLYGRGACDMKGAVAAMVTAAIRLKAERLDGPLVVALTADEESGGMVGAYTLAQHPWFPPGGRLVIGEPTGMRLGIAQKGALWLRLRFDGRPAHGAYPEEGANAIDSLVAALPLVTRVVAATPSHPVLGKTTVNVALIGGGAAPNMVADSAWAQLDFRTVPGVGHAALVDNVRAAALEHLQAGVTLAVEVLADHAALSIASEDELVAVAADAVRSVTGALPAAVGFSYYTDAAAFHSRGSYTTLLLGPGDPTIAHQVDEHVAIADLGRAADAYVEIARRILVH
jgi:succinyl-diaminopimelate desuccinylase